MNRIVLMLIRNFWRVPGAYWKLCHYAKHTGEYQEAVKYKHIQYIFRHAVNSGNIDFKVYGKENIPTENGFVIYANHQGMFDILAIVASCDNPIGAVLKKELAHIPMIKQLVACSHSFPMDREDIRQSMEVIRSVSKEIEKGRNYLIFPEGTRSRKGNCLLEFHGGSFKCATKTKCPILPAALIDSYKAFDRKGSGLIAVQVHYLKPIYYEEYKNLKASEIAVLVRNRIKAVVENSEIPDKREN